MARWVPDSRQRQLLVDERSGAIEVAEPDPRSCPKNAVVNDSGGWSAPLDEAGGRLVESAIDLEVACCRWYSPQARWNRARDSTSA